VAFAALALGAVYLWKSAQESNGRLQARVSAARADAGDLQTRLDAEKAKAGDLEKILAGVSKPGARIARLAGQAAAPSFSAAILWDTEQKQCLILGILPPAPKGKAYQLWFVTPAAKVSAGLIKNDPAGRVFTTVGVPGNAADATAALVTLEPDNGSQIPTAPYYAVGRFN
jgi:hypothetical protein